MNRPPIRDWAALVKRVQAEINRCCDIMVAEGLRGPAVSTSYHASMAMPAIALFPPDRIALHLERVSNMSDELMKFDLREQMATVALHREHRPRELSWMRSAMSSGPRPKMDQYKGTRWEYWWRKFEQ